MRRPMYSRDAYNTNRQGRTVSLQRWTPGIASEFIEHLPSLLARKRPPCLVLYIRVSSRAQELAGNLRDQMADAIQTVRNLGFRIGQNLKVFAGVEHSSIFNPRPLLEDAITEARESGGVLVAVHRDRFLRHRFCKGKKGEKFIDPPRIYEYKCLRSWSDGVCFATIVDPDSPTARSEQIKRGQKAKGKKGGRPPLGEHERLRRAVQEKLNSLPPR